MGNIFSNPVPPAASLTVIIQQENLDNPHNRQYAPGTYIGLLRRSSVLRQRVKSRCQVLDSIKVKISAGVASEEGRNEIEPELLLHIKEDVRAIRSIENQAARIRPDSRMIFNILNDIQSPVVREELAGLFRHRKNIAELRAISIRFYHKNGELPESLQTRIARYEDLLEQTLEYLENGVMDTASRHDDAITRLRCEKCVKKLLGSTGVFWDEAYVTDEVPRKSNPFIKASKSSGSHKANRFNAVARRINRMSESTMLLTLARTILQITKNPKIDVLATQQDFVSLNPCG